MNIVHSNGTAGPVAANGKIAGGVIVPKELLKEACEDSPNKRSSSRYQNILQKMLLAEDISSTTAKAH